MKKTYNAAFSTRRLTSPHPQALGPSPALHRRSRPRHSRMRCTATAQNLRRDGCSGTVPTTGQQAAASGIHGVSSSWYRKPHRYPAGPSGPFSSVSLPRSGEIPSCAAPSSFLLQPSAFPPRTPALRQEPSRALISSFRGPCNLSTTGGLCPRAFPLSFLVPLVF